MSKDSWVAVVVTPIMQRAQRLESAQDVIFVDSTSSCDTEGNTATVLLTATKAGAVPVAVVLHSSQTRDCYRAASQLLKEKYPTCFGNNQAPAAFMSDNSRPEKDALRDVWPSSKQLLFIFHVLQAEWCWLMSAPSLGKEDRRNLITSFQKVPRQDLDENYEQKQLFLVVWLHGSCRSSEDPETLRDLLRHHRGPINGFITDAWNLVIKSAKRLSLDLSVGIIVSKCFKCFVRITCAACEDASLA
ncbi:hypothetical protein MRX96_000963 [Rhipicephalus microplus]